MKKHSGGCHCKKVRFEVEIDLSKPVIECNCSYCQVKGMLLSFAPASSFTLTSGEDMLSEHRFNKKTIAHLFCKTCGVQSFGRGEGPQGATVAINVRALDDIDISTLERNQFNGKDM
jgi:hypothetical protein